MTEATRLLELAERVEAAEGPDRELDALVFIAVLWPTYRLQTTCEQFPDAVKIGRIQEGDDMGWREAPAYTASLDAAMTLVPEGYDWAVFRTNGGLTVHAWCGSREDVFAATPALALTAACLRARAAQGGEA